MNIKGIALCLMVLAILSGVVGLPAISKKLKDNSLANDKTQVGNSNSEYYQSTGALSVYPTDISTMTNNEITIIYRGLIKLHGDEEYVKEKYKQVDVDNLMTNRYVSNLNNRQKKFVTHVDYLDIVLTDKDFGEDVDNNYIIEVTDNEKVNLDEFQFGGWEDIELNVQYLTNTDRGILASGNNNTTNKNIFEFTPSSIPSKLERIDLTQKNLFSIDYFNKTSLAGYTDPTDWLLSRR